MTTRPRRRTRTAAAAATPGPRVARTGARLLACLGAGATVAALAVGAGAGAATAAGAHHPSDDPGTTATAPVTYSCSGVLGPVTISVTADLANVTDGDPTGLPLPDGLGVQMVLDLPDQLFGFLDGLGLGGIGGGLGGGLGGLGGILGGLGGGTTSGGTDVTTGQLGGFSMLFGGFGLPVPDPTGAISGATDPVMTATGSTAPITLPAPGSYPIALPESFTFSPLSSLGVDLFSITCQRVGDGVVDDLTVARQSSTVRAVPASTRSAAPLTVTVKRQLGGAGTGTVVATLAGRTVGHASLAKGAARMVLPASARGRSVVVRYLGNTTTSASTTTVRAR